MNEWPKTDPDGILYFRKDSESIAEFGHDWTNWLLEPGNGAIILTSDWDVPVGLTLLAESFDTQRTKVKVSGGTVGQTYELTNTITTNLAGLIEPRVIRIKIVDKISG